ncbi:hypothetical protein [Actinoplanes palleronii]|uniref:Uncharacterized protein n=1 Tax=Actinoplanes palleronii TaxID=113570 RepID=A0ABQ4BFJ1_9ACTN|nr:hypothetical protein [Actinoplanes palleronii]GIE69422.1 hypothetical protein Apa02nite_055300 [Actinoplanes palleronii]
MSDDVEQRDVAGLAEELDQLIRQIGQVKGGQQRRVGHLDFQFDQLIRVGVARGGGPQSRHCGAPIGPALAPCRSREVPEQFVASVAYLSVSETTSLSETERLE